MILGSRLGKAGTLQWLLQSPGCHRLSSTWNIVIVADGQRRSRLTQRSRHAWAERAPAKPLGSYPQFSEHIDNGIYKVALGTPSNPTWPSPRCTRTLSPRGRLRHGHLLHLAKR